MPVTVRDYTPDLREWKQQAYNDLPHNLRSFIAKVEEDFDEKCDEIAHRPSGMEQRISEVLPGIFIGNRDVLQDRGLLREKRIKAVLNMALEVNACPEVYGIDAFKIGIDDGVLARVGVFEKAAEVIHRAKQQDKPILVHCQAGRSRSATAVIAYLMLYDGLGYWRALSVVRYHRPEANPHPLLVRTLIRDLTHRFKP